MIETLMFAGWLVSLWYGVRAVIAHGGPHKVLRAAAGAPWWVKVLLVLSVLPIPGPFDELGAVVAMKWLAENKPSGS
jgi:hypothetical protein